MDQTWGSKLLLVTTSEGEVIQFLSDCNLCSSGWTLLCSLLLNLLRAVQTVSSAERNGSSHHHTWAPQFFFFLFFFLQLTFPIMPTQPASVFTTWEEEATGEREGKVRMRKRTAECRDTVGHWAELGHLTPHWCKPNSGTAVIFWLEFQSFSPLMRNVKERSLYQTKKRRAWSLQKRRKKSNLARQPRFQF